MSRDKTINVQVRHRISHDNLMWLNEMETLGADKSSVINLALNILRPRIENIGTTNRRIAETILMSPPAEY